MYLAGIMRHVVSRLACENSRVFRCLVCFVCFLLLLGIMRDFLLCLRCWDANKQRGHHKTCSNSTRKCKILLAFFPRSEMRNAEKWHENSRNAKAGIKILVKSMKRRPSRLDPSHCITDSNSNESRDNRQHYHNNAYTYFYLIQQKGAAAYSSKDCSSKDCSSKDCSSKRTVYQTDCSSNRTVRQTDCSSKFKLFIKI